MTTEPETNSDIDLEISEADLTAPEIFDSPEFAPADEHAIEQFDSRAGATPIDYAAILEQESGGGKFRALDQPAATIINKIEAETKEWTQIFSDGTEKSLTAEIMASNDPERITAYQAMVENLLNTGRHVEIQSKTTGKVESHGELQTIETHDPGTRWATIVELHNGEVNFQTYVEQKDPEREDFNQAADSDEPTMVDIDTADLIFGESDPEPSLQLKAPLIMTEKAVAKVDIEIPSDIIDADEPINQEVLQKAMAIVEQPISVQSIIPIQKIPESTEQLTRQNLKLKTGHVEPEQTPVIRPIIKIESPEKVSALNINHKAERRQYIHKYTSDIEVIAPKKALVENEPINSLPELNAQNHESQPIKPIDNHNIISERILKPITQAVKIEQASPILLTDILLPDMPSPLLPPSLTLAVRKINTPEPRTVTEKTVIKILNRPELFPSPAVTPVPVEQNRIDRELDPAIELATVEQINNNHDTILLNVIEPLSTIIEETIVLETSTQLALVSGEEVEKPAVGSSSKIIYTSLTKIKQVAEPKQDFNPLKFIRQPISEQQIVGSEPDQSTSMNSGIGMEIIRSIIAQPVNEKNSAAGIKIDQQITGINRQRPKYIISDRVKPEAIPVQRSTNPQKINNRTERNQFINSGAISLPKNSLMTNDDPQIVPDLGISANA